MLEKYAPPTKSSFLDEVGRIGNWPQSQARCERIGTEGFTPPQLHNSRIVSAGEAANTIKNTMVYGCNLDDNWIIAPSEFAISNKLHVFFGNEAKSNVLVLGNNADISGTIKFNGLNGLCVFGAETVHASNFYVVLSGRNTTFFFGEKGSSNGLNVYVAGDDRSVVIGNDCMAAQKPTIMTSDVHAIVDLETREWLNRAADVVIEPHVWLGMESTILKGCEIGFGSVVGTKAVITRSVPRRSLVVGAPAKVLKRNIAWVRPLIPNDRAIEQVIKAGLSFPDFLQGDTDSRASYNIDQNDEQVQ